MADPESPESTLERIMGERRAKAAALRDAGSHPFRNDIGPSSSIAEVRARYEHTKPAQGGSDPIDGELVRIAGRAMTKRDMGKTVFVPVRDTSAEIQLFLNAKQLDKNDYDKILPQLDAGDMVCAEGPVFWTKTGEMSVQAKRLWITAKSLRPLPDKFHGLSDKELRYRQRYVDLAINADVREVFRRRTAIVSGIRRFLDARKFMEVETPMMHPIIGGAAAKPFKTHHNALNMPLYLRIAPELYLKRLVVGGFERVYEINRNFRNEGLSRQHNPEFTMLELYQAYATYTDLMDMTEQLFGELAQSVTGGTKVTWDGTEVDLAPGWQRLTICDAVRTLGGIAEASEVFDNPVVAADVALRVGVPAADVVRVLLEHAGKVTMGDLGVDSREALVAGFKSDKAHALAERISASYDHQDARRIAAGHLGYLVFEATAESKLVQPTFLTQFPVAVSPLARKNDKDPAFCDRFELFVCGKELANGFSELNDPDDQRSRFEAQMRAKDAGADETMDYDDDYCRALEIGMPPTAGEGIGIDRLAMLLTNSDSIRDVLLFPLMRGE